MTLWKHKPEAYCCSCEMDFIQGFCNTDPFVTSQVGFKSVSDYITYAWVKDDQVSFNEELFQVCNVYCMCFFIYRYNCRFVHNIVIFHRFIWTKMKFQFLGESVCCVITAATCSVLWVLVNLSRWVTHQSILCMHQTSKQ